MRSIVSCILIIAMLIGMCPAASAAETEYTIMEVRSEKTYLKADCYSKSKTYETAYKGDLVYAVDETVNEHGNRWHRVLRADGDAGEVSYAYVYGGDVRPHECEFSEFSDNSVILYYCRCGQMQVIEGSSDTYQIGYAEALNPTGILNPEDMEAVLDAVAAARGFIKTAGSQASKAVKAMTNPYIWVPVVISAGVIWIVLACDGVRVTIDHVKENYKPFSDTDMENGKYYCALVLPNTSEVLFMDLPGTEMDIKEAAAFMTLVGGFSNAFRIQKHGGERQLFGNVYTPNFSDAERLCELLVTTGVFDYWNDSGTAKRISVNKNKIPGVEYYRHFHLRYCGSPVPLIGSMMTHPLPHSKVAGSHIFCGSPVKKPII